MRSRDTLRAVAIAAITVAGCRVVASRADYASYRNFRYAAEGSDRLAAASEYLQAQPQGRFRPEVQAVVNATEEDYWADHRASLDGLNEYLRAFSAGSHVDEARQRLAVYERTRQEAEVTRRAAEDADRQRREEELQATATRSRVWGRASFNRWIRLFGGINAWGRGVGEIVQANPEFGAAFENTPPQCRASHCRKDYVQDFFIPVPGRSALPRRATLSLDMVRIGTERNVNQVFTVMRNRGLTQWWELETQTAADPSDPQAREVAVRWAMDQLRAIVALAFPEAKETPAELYGPPPEAMVMGGEEDENAAPEAVDPNACLVPSQPLGTRWSAIIGCAGVTARPFAAPAEATQAQAQAMPTAEPAVTPHACLRIDAYAALDGEGMSTDEGVSLSLIPACATTVAAPVRPGARPRPVVRPARPAAPAR